jgi:hypothetical protein
MCLDLELTHDYIISEGLIGLSLFDSSTGKHSEQSQLKQEQSITAKAQSSHNQAPIIEITFLSAAERHLM